MSLLTMTSPRVRFPVTVCVISYGPHVELTRRLLETLYAKTDPSLFQLRAGLNEVESATLDEFRRFAARHGNIELWSEPANIFKCRMMRRLFHERRIESRWTLWCDDDTYFHRADWLPRLALNVERYPEVVLWGLKAECETEDPDFGQWIRDARWYRGLPTRVMPGNGAATRYAVPFIAGGFWAIRTDVIYALDWPDPRLVQAADDIMLGEALRQNGLAFGHFDYGVQVNDAPRRNSHAPEVIKLPRHESP